MGHQNKKSLTYQVKEVLDSKLAIGFPKKLDKLIDDTSNHIYSWSTYKNYLKHSIYFVNWCKDNHNCKTLQDCKPYIGEWLHTRDNLSAYTIKLEMAAICKLYNITTQTIKDEYNYTAPKRTRANIKRSRYDTELDKHFSETNNIKFVTFCKCTGLRRMEIKSLKPNKLIVINNKYHIIVDSGSKGGRPRTVPVMADTKEELNIVISIFTDAIASGQTKVFDKIPFNCDIHSYRAEYAKRCYLSKARPLESLTRQETYCMRADRKGVHLDRAAMLFASRCLGHNRIDVVASHYLDSLNLS